MKILIIFLFIPTLLFAEIREISRLHELLSSLEGYPEAVVVFDIDNTLLESSQQLGSVAWADFMIADFERKGISKREALEIESVFWTIVQPHIPVRPVDPDTVEVLNRIHKQKAAILCLTSRTPQELTCTLSQLKSIGIDLSLFASESSQEVNLPPTVLYSSGILFCTPHHLKSEVLIAYLENKKMRPERVVFVDDKLSHVCDVHRGLEEKGISCAALRYKGADRQHHDFDPKIAEMQWRAFPQVLPDEVARRFIY